jgi:hypothetical protein
MRIAIFIPPAPMLAAGGAAGLMVATSKDGVAPVVCPKAAQDVKSIRAARMLTRRILEISWRA